MGLLLASGAASAVLFAIAHVVIGIGVMVFNIMQVGYRQRVPSSHAQSDVGDVALRGVGCGGAGRCAGRAGGCAACPVDADHRPGRGLPVTTVTSAARSPKLSIGAAFKRIKQISAVR
ncbi:MAG: hypothetical protein ACRDQZ_22715 [Mycobacteriales bacterium]